MYYDDDDDDDDDDPYAPRIGPAAMPSPRSKFAPYYSGHADSFEDFLEEFEALAYDCALTDPQRVDVIIRYVDPSIREFWKSLNGYRSRDWPLFRQSLIDVFGNPTPRHQIMRQKLHSHVQDSSRRRMDCEDDVLQYYRQFLCYSAPLVHAGHLSEEERDAAFWYGFHPEDRKVIQPRLLGKNPFQPPDIPFHFEDVFVCARAAFAYDGSSFWSHVKQFQSPSVRREQPVVEPIPRDFYSFRAVTCSIASNAETTTTPDDSSLPSYSTPDSDFPLSSISPSESQQMQAPSVTLDQPETAYTLSSTLLPSASPTPFHTHSLAPSAAADVPEISSTPLSSPEPAPTLLSTPPSSSSISPTFVPSATEHQSEPSTPTLFASVPTLTSTPSHVPSATDYGTIFASTPPSSSSISPTFVPSATEHQSEPESAPTLLPSIPTPPSSPLHVHSAINNFASTPPCSSPTSSTCLPLVTEEQPEPEPEPIPSITPASTFAPTPPFSSTFLLSPVSMRSAVNSQPELEPALASECLIPPSPDHVPEIASTPPSSSSVSLTNLESVPSAMVDQPESEPEHASLSSITPTHSLSRPSLPLEFPDDVREILSLPLTPLSASLARSDVSTSLSSPTKPSPSEVPTSKLDLSPHAAPKLDAVPVLLSSSESSLSSLGEAFPLLPAQHEVSVAVPASRHSTPPQRSLGCKPVSSVSSALDVTPSFALLIPRLGCRDSPLVYEAPSTRLPTLAPPSLLSLRRTPARFSFAFVFITTAALVSTLCNASTTLPTFAHKYWSKQEDIGNNRIGTFKTSKSSNTFAHRLRLGQLTPRAPRLVFDPGGQSSSSSSSSQVSNHSQHTKT
ncbi:hypothetical protein EDB85DRAFT_1146371 [Lactarius pseudohatsudake]|nr:hypothetical protein EDB85DRAFT_1146371 [Lactarius pseudohatsudake]